MKPARVQSTCMRRVRTQRLCMANDSMADKPHNEARMLAQARFTKRASEPLRIQEYALQTISRLHIM